ncbi:MAG: RidA family protein [Deltaproteobacteria bacterium]|nr:MAG: RidA family protein [Deltaproteobacteria bacterium]
MGDRGAVKRTTITTKDAPAAIGAYSQAVVVEGGRILFASGQIALDPATGEMVGEDAASQARQCLVNLRAVLAAAGMSMEHVVRATIYLSDMQDFATVNAVYGEFFASDTPARAAVQAAGLPKGARVEIDAIAVAD